MKRIVAAIACWLFSSAALAAVTVDVATEHERTDTTSPQTFSHAAAGSGVKGVLCSLAHGTSSTDHVSAASYGGVAMTRIVRATDTAVEPGASEFWFLGASVPQGTQTVSYTPGSTDDDFHAVCVSLLGDDDLEVIDFDSDNEDSMDPTLTMQYGGRTAMSFAAIYWGGANVGVDLGDPTANSQVIHNFDMGAFVTETIRQTTAGTSDFALGWDGSSTDDTAMVAVAVSEVEASCAGAPTITDVDTDEIVTATQTNVVITLTNGCDTQGGGSVTLRQNGNSKTLSVDSWSDTSIQVDMSGVGMNVANGLLYGSMDVRVTNDDAQSDDQAITTNPPSGTQYRTMSGGLATLEFDEFGNRSRVYGDPLDLQTTSQVAYRNAQGCTLDALDGAADTGNGDTGVEGDEDDIYVRVNASLFVGATCTAADFDFSRDSLYVGQDETISFVDAPPEMGGIDIDDHVLADGLAMTAYDLDDYFFAGDAALDAYAMRQLSNPVDSTTDVNGAVTDSTSLVVDDASVLLDHFDGWIRCASGSPVQILGEAVNPLTNTITLRSPITCADNAQVDTYTNGTQSVSGITVNAGTGAVSGTPDTDATTSLLLYRVTDADALFAEVRLSFEIDVITIPDTTADDRTTAVSALEALGITVDTDYVCSSLEALEQVLAQTPSSFLWGTQVEIDVVGGCRKSRVIGVGVGLGVH